MSDLRVAVSGQWRASLRGDPCAMLNGVTDAHRVTSLGADEMLALRLGGR
jgi:hypothetical protein